MDKIKKMLLMAPTGQLDPGVFPLIEAWDVPPTSIQVLQVIDWCIYEALASDFTLRLLQTLYDMALMREGRKHEDNIPLASWRQTTVFNTTE
jgi:hypothetical protein